MTGGKRRTAACGVACIALAVMGAVAGCDRSGEATAADTGDAVAEPLASPAVNLDPGQAPARPARAEVTPTVAAPARPAPARPAPPSSVQVEFDPPMIDLGIVKPNQAVRATVQIRNVGDKHVRILTVKPSCKCTTIGDLTGKVIAPGESVPLEAELEPQPITGRRTATISVVFEGAAEPYEIELLAEVSLPVRANPAILNLASGETKGHIIVESIDGQPFTVLSAGRRVPDFVGFDPDLDEPTSTYVLRWDLTAQVADNTLDRWWIIETDHPEAPIADAWVRHRSTIDFSIRQRSWRVPSRRSIIGYVDKDGSKVFTIDVEGLGTDKIYAVRSLTSDFNAELVNFERKGDDAVCAVRITPKAGFTGLLYGRMEMLASGDAHQQDVIGKVR